MTQIPALTLSGTFSKHFFNEHFPETPVKFNINKHKLNGYMTDELLEARTLKLKLHKKYLKSRSLADKDIYINHRNSYNTLLRQCKKNIILKILT